uniref:Uncharacterized protein n=1 Tax=Lepeophtheirus salmonis TaxID=72036 RepID=A0A0K2SZD8_LEPSM
MDPHGSNSRHEKKISLSAY